MPATISTGSISQGSAIGSCPLRAATSSAKLITIGLSAMLSSEPVAI
jgi:hypothetical protein